jgi:uncharacterized coiled-coil DUF342 family protein
MELSGEAVVRVDVGGYKTPLGKLARRFKASLESWKTKYQELRRQLKRYQNRAADAARSRDGWKKQSQHWKACAEQLQAEVDRLRAETADPKSKPHQRS